MKITKALEVFIRRFDEVERTSLADAMQRERECWTTPEEAWASIIADYEETSRNAEATAVRIRRRAAACAKPGKPVPESTPEGT